MFETIERYTELWCAQDAKGVEMELREFESKLQKRIQEREHDEGAGAGTIGAAVAGGMLLGGPVGIIMLVGLGYGLLGSSIKDNSSKATTTGYKQLMAEYKVWSERGGGGGLRGGGWGS